MAKRILAFAIVLLGTIAVSPSFAQEDDQSVPACELSGGYGFMRDFDLEENVPAGWYFSAAGNFTRWFGLVGEFTGSHKTVDDAAPFVTLKATLLTGMGGPRFFRKYGRVVPYGQALVGAAYVRAKASSIYGSASDNETDFAFQPGGGVLLYFNNRVGAQVAADYRWINPGGKGGDEDSSEFRFLTGVVVGFGSR